MVRSYLFSRWVAHGAIQWLAVQVVRAKRAWGQAGPLHVRGGVARVPSEPIARPWITTDPKRVVGRGHPAGDFLEAWAWEVLEEGDATLRVSAHLPDRVINPRGQLFGGFTPTYVDLIALLTGLRCVPARGAGPRVIGVGWRPRPCESTTSSPWWARGSFSTVGASGSEGGCTS